MVRSRDTHPEDHAARLEVYRAISPGRRLRLALVMSECARASVSTDPLAWIVAELGLDDSWDPVGRGETG